MPLTKAQCPNCGGALEVDASKEAAVCPFCNTPYIVEKAINNYTTNITNNIQAENLVIQDGASIKIDDSKEIENLFILARRAKKDQDNEKAAEYYQKILLKQPENREAYYYAVYCKFLSSTLLDIPDISLALKNCDATAIEQIQKDLSGKEEQIAAIKELATNSLNAFVNMWQNAKDTFIKQMFVNGTPYNNAWLIPSIINSIDGIYDLGDRIDRAFSDAPDIPPIVAEIWNQGIVADNETLMFNFFNKETKRKRIQEYTEKVQKYKSDYKEPEKKSGCYVATCVYGSYDCPEVWTLRRYRDDTLASTRRGRAFIRTYYAVSPTLVKWFGKTKWFKKMWQGKLDRMVKRLNDNGVENTPYQDRNW